MIYYVKGDATNPNIPNVDLGHKLIIHSVNDEGKWGAGFVLALSKRWSSPEKEYRDWYNRRSVMRVTQNHKVFESNVLRLGEFQSIKVEKDTDVINVVGQSGVRSESNPKPVKYSAISEAFYKLNSKISRDEEYYMMDDSDDSDPYHVTIHMPRIGCGLGGGSWSEIEPIIKATMPKRHIYVYDLP